MEFPDLGEHCSEPTCKKLDYLPVKCDACGKLFCAEHFHHAKHSCQVAEQKDYRVPVCPLCNTPISGNRGLSPDNLVDAHISNDCAIIKSKVFSNKCSMKNCKAKEVVEVRCSECYQNFCLKHRHSSDHSCKGAKGRNMSKISTTSTANNPNAATSAGNYLREDEELARALALSMETHSQVTQEQIDFMLAKQLQETEERNQTNYVSTNQNRRGRDRCDIS